MSNNNNKNNDYYDSINDFLDYGRKLIVLHEPNNKEKNTEEFFLLLNKKSTNENLENIFNNLQNLSEKNISCLSKASQLFIASKSNNFYFIHLTSMSYSHDNKENMIKSDMQYISENFRSVLSTAYPILISEYKNTLSEFCVPSVNLNSFNSEQSGEIIKKVSGRVVKEIKKDTDEFLNLTREIFQATRKEANHKMQQKIEASIPIIEQNITKGKDKIEAFSASILYQITKQKKIISKMKK